MESTKLFSSNIWRSIHLPFSVQPLSFNCQNLYKEGSNHNNDDTVRSEGATLIANIHGMDDLSHSMKAILSNEPKMEQDEHNHCREKLPSAMFWTSYIRHYSRWGFVKSESATTGYRYMLLEEGEFAFDHFFRIADAVTEYCVFHPLKWFLFFLPVRVVVRSCSQLSTGWRAPSIALFLSLWWQMQ